MSHPGITITGYVDPWSLHAGDCTRLKVCDHAEQPCQVDLVRLTAHGVPPAEHRLEERVVPGVRPVRFQGLKRVIHLGSCAIVPTTTYLETLRSFTVTLRVLPTRAGSRPQALIGTWSEATRDGFGVFLDARGAPTVRVGRDGRTAQCTTDRPLRNRAWAHLTVWYDGASGRLGVHQRPLPTHSPGFDLSHRGASCEIDAEPELLAASGRDLLIAAWHREQGQAPRGGYFDGRIEAPRLAARPKAERFDAEWDFALGMETAQIKDRGSAGLDGQLVNCPARAVTGSRWNATEHRWKDAVEQWGGIHFHSDDLCDAKWETDAEVELPQDLPSGIYALRVTSDDGRSDRVPLFVRAARGAPSADVLFLVPTATYLAYANHRLHQTLGVAVFGGSKQPHHDYLEAHPELGPDTYGSHCDGTGCMYSSRLRPIVNLRPGADGWAFSADLALTGFFAAHRVGYDVATDEDLHREGTEVLSPYRVIVTGSHPEYWSTPMLDALEAWQRAGGRLMYVGGNGFYWRVAFSDHFPGVMELRRADSSTRAWPAQPGEYYHAFTGELGGLWRNIGRPPNAIAGVGFTAQGAGGTGYRQSAAISDPRAAWIFEGTRSQEGFGNHGRLGHAADEEIDRFDPRLGSPPHALVLGSSGPHGPGMMRVIEEFLITLPLGPDPDTRADLVFYETPGGGAVFSTGSIGWIAALAHDRYQNDVARITANVLRRFSNPEPFVLPADAPDAPATGLPYYFPDLSGFGWDGSDGSG